MLTLIVRRPDRRDESVPLPVGEVVIGRAEDCALRVDDPSVSRRHAAVWTDQEGQGWVRDLGSRNGTRLNGKRVGAEPLLLRNGDRIQIGRGGIVLRYFNDEATVTQESPAGLLPLTEFPQEALWALGGRWQALLRTTPWLRLLAAVLGAVAALLAVTFWVTRLMGG